MFCPTKYINKKIRVPSIIENYEFFSCNYINNWSFKNFIRSFNNFEHFSLEDITTKRQEYVSSLNFFKQLENLDCDLLNYITELIEEKYSDEAFIQLLNPSTQISNTKISDITIDEKNIKVITDENKSSIKEVIFIKLNNNDTCNNEYVVIQYIKNVEEQSSLYSIKEHPALIKFLKEAIEQELENFFFWLGAYPFDINISEDEKKDLIFGKLVLTDYYTNCTKPKILNTIERAPFVEYIVPLFKYFSAAFRNIAFQWCEKRLNINKYNSLYHLSDNGKRSFADGVEVVLMESTVENNDDHTNEDMTKLLEYSIISLKAEMEKMKFASLESFKKIRFLTCLYSKNKLTLFATFLVDSKRWGFTFVREAIVPRSWADRYAWLQVFELMFCLKDYLEKQTKISNELVKEASGWIEVKGVAVKDMEKS